ncbi:MAG: DUF1924 domain-containing protein [Pseudomonadales bacterium]|nr:DUF1924 domain-containing protein [Pseudomonadales bacterium]
MKTTIVHAIVLATTFASSLVVAGEAAESLLETYRGDLGAQFAFDAEDGKAFWYAEHNGHSCATCHGDTPREEGRHTRTGKTIDPMAPTVNPERFRDADKVEKWFLRNCKWTVGRECTTAEKGNMLEWLIQQ